MRFANKNPAYEYFKKNLKDVIGVREYNKGRHLWINTRTINYYIIYKERPFQSFYRQFEAFSQKNPEITGYGESINETYLKIASSLPRTIIVIIYQNGSMYWIKPKEWLDYSQTHNLIRTQDKSNFYKLEDYSGQKEAVNEVTYSIPLKILQRFEFVI